MVKCDTVLKATTAIILAFNKDLQTSRGGKSQE
jgi:hypothetical protein